MPYRNTKNQSSLLSVAKYQALVFRAPIVWAWRVAGFAFREPGLTHITSRRVLISQSDNNYQEEYTQNDFFVIFMHPRHKEREITAL